VILFPAIDLKDGRVVRLTRGAMESATIYGEDPAAQARAFEAVGFSWLHVVDLDGAFAGAPRNAPAVETILAAVRIPVQLGGGIRDLGRIAAWLEAGVARVILGTIAARDPDLVREAARRHPGQIVVGIDARDGAVAVSGWAETAAMSDVELARSYEDAGVAAIVHTNISRDGTGAGLDVEGSLRLARAVSIPVIVSGGLGSMADIARLLRPDAAVLEGAIAGRALYDGRLDPAAALAAMAAGVAA
jgi:phosphoribosylformimino-5-aminoimidazole carboxamide ribotide isomerase